MLDISRINDFVRLRASHNDRDRLIPNHPLKALNDFIVNIRISLAATRFSPALFALFTEATINHWMNKMKSR